jgi:hypothetical protein
MASAICATKMQLLALDLLSFRPELQLFYHERTLPLRLVSPSFQPASVCSFLGQACFEMVVLEAKGLVFLEFGTPLARAAERSLIQR